MTTPDPPGGRPAATGQVSEFSYDDGLGVVSTADGRRLRFHCTQIAGGSRRIEVRTPVRFAIVPGRGGDWEAAAVTPLGPPPAPPGP